jgi:hypothetical protein
MASALDLSGYASAELTFDWLIENSFDSGEYLALDVYNGSSWINDVRRLNGNSDAENTWHAETIDLAPYLSTGTLIRFRASANGSNEDANVDNVRIVASGGSGMAMSLAAEAPSASAQSTLFESLAPFTGAATPHLRNTRLAPVRNVSENIVARDWSRSTSQGELQYAWNRTLDDSDRSAPSSWQRNSADGQYIPGAYDVALAEYVWDPFSSDLDNDSDSDGKPAGLQTV